MRMPRADLPVSRSTYCMRVTVRVILEA
jgi:hypothetical protein